MLQRRHSAALAALALLAAAPSAGAQDPFEPGLRWIRPAHLSDAWIPTSVGFAGDDQLCWSVANGATPRVDLESSAARGLSQPLFEDLLQDPIAGALRATTCTARNGLFVLQQTYGANPTERATRVTRYDPLAAATGAAFTPEWTLDLAFQANGPAFFLTDEEGTNGFVLQWNSQVPELAVCVVDLDSGGLAGYLTYPATSLESAAISADGSRVAVVTGTTLRILDAYGQQLEQRSLFTATPALAFDHDGTHLVVGSGGNVQVLTAQATGYQESLLLAGAPTELAKVVDVSADASVIAVGWWDATTGVDARFEVFDGATGQSLREVLRPGVPGGLQNSPSAVEVSTDGRRVACGSWGDGDSDAELVLLDLDQDQPVLEADLPGSVLHLDLDASGTRVLVAAKHLHANQMGITGELRLYDTGERDLQLLEPPRPGGRLHLAARTPGANAAWFLIGREQDTPFSGGLALARQGLRVIAGSIQDDVSELDVPLPAGQRLLGLSPTIQAAWRTEGGLEFSSTLVRPSFL
ncbi:MAG: hypothetical protein H6831_04865 [Planctomycetes bacterium]|nr:hypothetical protein [Planctomycetota bacterium]MCB9903721.1 hypothetical protein [Planctomycetota bacterium]